MSDNYTSKKLTPKQEESMRSVYALREILFLINNLDKTDRITLIRILKQSDAFKYIIEKGND